MKRTIAALTLLLPAVALAASHTYTIQAPTQDEDGSPRTVETLDFYDFYCAGETTSTVTVPVSGPTQNVTVFRPNAGSIDCYATVTAATGETSAPSNTVAGTFIGFPPSAPVLQ